MGLAETIVERCREIGLDDTTSKLTKTTIRAPDVLDEETTTRRSDPARSAPRELPRISVDVRSSLSGASAAARDPEAPVRDLELVTTLGEGGMGRVFLARQHSLGREVAIKTLRDHASEDERRALVAEGAITGSLEHPSIVPVHALGLDDHGRPVLVMKRVVGRPWSSLIEEQTRSLDDHLAILVQVCNAVDFAHSKGILHRDIKPQNVLVGDFGEVQLCDFGVAIRLAEARDPRQISGTPAYMAPEMVVGARLDARTDVYLLGATLHHVLTGAPRHHRSTVRETLVDAAQSKPFAYPPSVPPALAELANAATARDPAHRPESAARFREALLDHQRHKSSVSLAASAASRVASLHDVANLSDEAAQRRFDLLAAEARLALTHALAEWPDNELARGALADLDALLDARRTRAAELARLADDLDPMVSRSQRVAVSAAITVVALVLAVINVVRGGRGVGTKDLLAHSLVPLGLGVAVIAAARRHVLRNALNRRVVASFFVCVGSVTLSRILAHLAGLSAQATLLQDLVMLVAASALLGVLLDRGYAMITAIALPAAIVAARFPERAITAFSLVSGSGLLVATIVAMRTRPRR